MRKHIVFLLSVIALLSNAVLAAEKAVPDPRLSQKISIDCVNTRLYKALDQISAESGVIIRTGRTQSDWKVRDIPVLVCARDIQLGVLLQGIADTTHLLLSGNKADYETITYRIWRDKKREDELTAFEEEQNKAAAKIIGYDWDTLCLLKDLPTSDYYNIYASKIINAIDNETKNRIFAGETVVLSTLNAQDSVKPHIRSFFEKYWESLNEYRTQDGGEAIEPLDAQRLNKCFVEIRTRAGLQMLFFSGGHGMKSIYSDRYSTDVQRNIPDYPKRPELPKQIFKFDDISSRYKPLSLKKDVDPGFMNKKLKIALPFDGNKQTYPYLLCRLSQAIGYSIVAEGTAARCFFGNDTDKKLLALFEKEITAYEALAFSKDLGMQWYLDENNKLIIGRDLNWIEAQKTLVPEKLLQDIKGKLKIGIELEDLDALSELTLAQCYGLRGCNGFEKRNEVDIVPGFEEVGKAAARNAGIDSKSIWALYFDLSPTDRKQARAGNPVSLIGYDRTALCKFIREYATKKMSEYFLNEGEVANESKLATMMINGESFTDPDAVPELMMWVEKVSLPKDVPEPFKGKHIYYLHLKSKEDGYIDESEQMVGIFPIILKEQEPEKQQIIK